MKKITAFCLLAASSFASAEYGLHFDDQGKIIQPDTHYLWEGFEDEKAGFRNDALKNFIRAAEYGNQHAMSLIAFYHMQDKEFEAAHAWFNLVDLTKIPNAEYLAEIIDKLEKQMSSRDLKKAKKLKQELAETYGPHPTLVKRDNWRKGLKFTGTHVKGHIPAFLRIELNSGMVVTGNNVRKQVDNFIYEYDFSLPTGEVKMDEIEVVDVGDSQ